MKAGEEQEPRRQHLGATALSPAMQSLSNELGSCCFSFPLARSASAAQRAGKLCHFVQIAAQIKQPAPKQNPGEKAAKWHLRRCF